MTLLVVTPTRDAGRWLPEAMDSIARYGPGAERVIVCPPTATPAAKAACRGATFVADDGGGLYAALNRGVRAAPATDAFTWLNDDDRLATGFADAVTQMERNPEIDVLYGRVALIDGEAGQLGELPVARSAPALGSLLARGIVPFAQPGTLIRRALFERLGGFDESYRLAGDLDFFVRALAAGARFEFVNRVVAEFRLSGGQLSKHEEIGDREKERALAQLPRGPRSGAAALLRFRWDNRRVYFDRIRRHGFVSMRTLYRQG